MPESIGSGTNFSMPRMKIGGSGVNFSQLVTRFRIRRGLRAGDRRRGSTMRASLE